MLPSSMSSRRAGPTEGQPVAFGEAFPSWSVYLKDPVCLGVLSALPMQRRHRTWHRSHKVVVVSLLSFVLVTIMMVLPLMATVAVISFQARTVKNDGFVMPAFIGCDSQRRQFNNRIIASRGGGQTILLQGIWSGHSMRCHEPRRKTRDSRRF